MSSRIWGGRFLKAALVACLPITTSVAMAAVESNDPIAIAQHDWAGSEFSALLLSRLLQAAGYSTKIITIDASSVNTALENGDITFQPEAWTTSHPEIEKLLTEKKVTEVGESGLVGMDRYWYPLYVKEKCPGLPSYKALNACAALFATPETGSKGRLLVYPEDWGGNDEKRVENLGLNFEVVHAGSEAALLAEVKAAVQRHQPILAWLYEPHWAPVAFKGEYVELPPYTKECIESGSFACEKPKGPILKLAYNGASAKWPGAYKIFKAMTLNNHEYGKALEEISLDGKTSDAVVTEWMDHTKDRWSAWLK